MVFPTWLRTAVAVKHLCQRHRLLPDLQLGSHAAEAMHALHTSLVSGSATPRLHPYLGVISSSK